MADSGEAKERETQGKNEMFVIHGVALVCETILINT